MAFQDPGMDQIGFNLIPWIEHLVPGEGEESSVGVKSSFEQLAEKLSEETTTINTRLVQTCSISIFIFFHICGSRSITPTHK